MPGNVDAFIGMTRAPRWAYWRGRQARIARIINALFAVRHGVGGVAKIRHSRRRCAISYRLAGARSIQKMASARAISPFAVPETAGDITSLLLPGSRRACAVGGGGLEMVAEMLRLFTVSLVYGARNHQACQRGLP